MPKPRPFLLKFCVKKYYVYRVHGIDEDDAQNVHAAHPDQGLVEEYEDSESPEFVEAEEDEPGD